MSRYQVRRYAPGNEPATDAQIQYLRRLLRQAFARRVTHGTGLDEHHLECLNRSGGKAYASSCITKILGLLAEESAVLGGES